MQHPDRVDVVKRPLTLEREQTALFDAQGAHLRGRLRAAAPFTGDGQGTGADVDRQQV